MSIQATTDAERLTLFVRRVEELLERRLVKSGNLNASLNIKASLTEPLSLTTFAPDDEDLRSFLMTFRHFVMKDEPVYVARVANILWRELEGDEWRSNLADARQHWKTCFQKGSLRLIVNDRHLTPEAVLDWWINGDYFHSDDRKRKELERLDQLSNVLARNVFMNVLVDTTRYITYLAQVAIVAGREGALAY